MEELKMFDVVYVDMTTDKVGSEQSGVRPAIIIQNNIGNKHSVNALNRAYYISTVPSGNPPVSRLSRLIFVCNCQNILIISFFYPFFCLFKNSILLSHHHSTISSHSQQVFYLYFHFLFLVNFLYFFHIYFVSVPLLSTITFM